MNSTNCSRTKMMNNNANRFSLFPEEKVITTTSLHWINLVMPGITIIICLILLFWRLRYINLCLINEMALKAIIPPPYQRYAVIISIVAFLLIILMSLVNIISSLLTRYYITNKRVITISGILTVRMSEMLLDRCETVNLSQNILERMLDSGDIMIISAGANLFLNDVPHVNSFRLTIMRMSAEYKHNSNF